jgi:Methyltransferase FkbM domain
MMNPLTSLRYIFGLYEHELNPWIAQAISQVDSLFDVGANHGYFSFGVMAAWRRLGRQGLVWAFEPQTHECNLMNNVAKLNESEGIHVRIENCFVSDQEGNLAVTLDGFLKKNGQVPTSRALVKIDVEGAEMHVLQGAKSLLLPENRFFVEVHGADLLKRTQAFFSAHGHPVQLVSQRPLPILGREARAKDNWWLVTKLES